MPPAIAAAGAFLGSTAFTIGTLAVSWGTVIGVAASFAFVYSQTKMPTFSATSLDNQIQTIRAPSEARDVVYGKVRKGGVLVLAHLTGESNNFLHLVVALAGHQCSDIPKVYFDDELAIDGNTVQAPYTSTLSFVKLLGSPNQVADSTMISDMPGVWTSDHRLRGICALYTENEWDPDVYINGIPNISAEVEGKILEMPDGTSGWSDNGAACIYDFLRDPDIGMGFAEKDIALEVAQSSVDECGIDIPLAGGGTEKKYTINGTFKLDGEPVEIIEKMLESIAGRLTFSSGLYHLIAGAWVPPVATLEERDIYSDVRLVVATSDKDTFNAVSGRFSDKNQKYQVIDFPPIISNTFAAIDGDDVGELIYDGVLTHGKAYRIESLEGGASFTNVGADINEVGLVFVADENTPDWNGGLPVWGSPLSTAITKIEFKGLDQGGIYGGRPNDDFRIKIGGVTVLDSKRNLAEYEDPFYYVWNGDATVGTLVEVDVFNGWRAGSGVPVKMTIHYAGGARREVIRGSAFTFEKPMGAPDTLPIPPDYVPAFEQYASNYSYVLEGPVGALQEKTLRSKFEDIVLSFTTSAATCQRIAKIILLESRQEQVFSATFFLNERTWACMPGQNVYLNHTRFGFVDKTFRVEKWGLTEIEDDLGNRAPAVEMSLKETAEVNYDWNTSEEQEVDPAPNTELPNPRVLLNPAGLILSTGETTLYTKGDGTLVTRIKAVWDFPENVFVTKGGYTQLQYKRTSDTDWEDQGTKTGGTTVAYIVDVEDGVAYDVRIRFLSTLGAQSDWTEAGIIADGKATPPSTPNGLAVSTVSTSLKLSWNAIADADVSEYKIFRSTVNNSTTGVEIAEVSGTVFIDADAIYGTTYYYWVKAVDTSENISSFSNVASGVVPRIPYALLDQDVFDDIATAQAASDGKITTFFQSTTPTAEGVGDLWVRTNDGNKLYRWSGSSWAAVQDQDIVQAINDAATAQNTADGKSVSYFQNNAPTGLTAASNGDLWVDTNNGNKKHYYSHPSWIAAPEFNSDPPSTPSTPTGVITVFDDYYGLEGRQYNYIDLAVVKPSNAQYMNILFKKASESSWRVANQVTSSGTYRIDDLEKPNIDYNFALQAYSYDGVPSAISGVRTDDTTGLSISSIGGTTSFALIENGIRFSWSITDFGGVTGDTLSDRGYIGFNVYRTSDISNTSGGGEFVGFTDAYFLDIAQYPTESFIYSVRALDVYDNQSTILVASQPSPKRLNQLDYEWNKDHPIAVGVRAAFNRVVLGLPFGNFIPAFSEEFPSVSYDQRIILSPDSKNWHRAGVGYSDLALADGPYQVCWRKQTGGSYPTRPNSTDREPPGWSDNILNDSNSSSSIYFFMIRPVGAFNWLNDGYGPWFITNLGAGDAQ